MDIFIIIFFLNIAQSLNDHVCFFLFLCRFNALIVIRIQAVFFAASSHLLLNLHFKDAEEVLIFLRNA